MNSLSCSATKSHSIQKQQIEKSKCLFVQVLDLCKPREKNNDMIEKYLLCDITASTPILPLTTPFLKPSSNFHRGTHASSILYQVWKKLTHFAFCQQHQSLKPWCYTLSTCPPTQISEKERSDPAELQYGACPAVLSSFRSAVQMKSTSKISFVKEMGIFLFYILTSTLGSCV